MKHFFSTILAVLMAVTAFNANAWVVSGSGAILNGETWNHSSSKNTMVQQNDGTYRLEVTDCTLEVGTTYEWLVTDGSNWIKTGGNDKGSNFTIKVDETAKYTVVYTFDGNETASAEVTKTGTAGEVSHEYSIAGTPASIFGTEWDPTNTSTNMTLEDGLYTWTSGEFTVSDGTMTIMFKVVVDHSWGEAYPSQDKQVTAPEGGPYTLTITFDATTKAVNATLNSATPIQHTYSIAGSNADIFGAEWDAANASTDMTLENGLYTWTSGEFTLDALEAVEFKVVEDHAWTVAYPSENWVLNIPAGGPYTVTITFDADSKEINATYDGQESTEHVYSIAGNHAIFGENEWDETATATEMTFNAEGGLYEWTSAEFSAAEAGEIQFKIVEDHSWNVSYPEGYENNYTVALPAGGPYTLYVAFNAETKEITHILNGAPVVADTYTVAGGFGDYVEGKTEDAVFGEWWNHALAANDMTLTEGLYTWTSAEFSSEADSKIEFKVVKNHSWDEGAWPTDNYYVAVPAGGPYTLTVTFDADSKEINAVLNGAVVTDVYSIAGSDAIFGENEWDATNQATEMALNAESGLYEWTSANFSAEEEYEIQFKVVKNHSWEQGEWPVGYENNYVVTVPAGGPYKLYVAFNLEENTISHELKSGVVAGDVNGDGEVDVTDVTAIANYVMGSVPEGFVLESADLNNDGDVDVSDVTALANKVMGN